MNIFFFFQKRKMSTKYRRYGYKDIIFENADGNPYRKHNMPILISHTKRYVFTFKGSNVPFYYKNINNDSVCDTYDIIKNTPIYVFKR